MLSRSLYLLLLLVAFSRDQYNVSWLRQPNRSFDRLLPVGYRDIFFPVCYRHSCFHIPDDLRRVLTSRVVAGKYDLVTVFTCNLPHYRPFSFITVTATTYQCDHLFKPALQFFDGL